MVIPEPTHSQEILNRHMCKVKMRIITHTRLREARIKVLESLAADAAIKNMDALLKTEDIHNKTEEPDLYIQEPLQIILTGNERYNHDAKWRRYRDRRGGIQKHRGEAFYIIRGQCKKVLIEKLSQILSGKYRKSLATRYH